MFCCNEIGRYHHNAAVFSRIPGPNKTKTKRRETSTINKFLTFPDPISSLENAPSIALFLLDNEDHEIGLLLSSFIAKSLGWRVFYLGQRVPANNIPGFVEKMNPDVMLTLFIAPINNTEISKIQRVFNTITSIPLLVSGSPYLTNMISESSQYVHVNNPQEFIEFLKKYEQ